MELNKRSMVIGVILTLICVAVGVVCLAVRPNTFTWIMFAVILALSIFQAISLWYMVKNRNESEESVKGEQETQQETKTEETEQTVDVKKVEENKD